MLVTFCIRLLLTAHANLDCARINHNKNMSIISTRNSNNDKNIRIISNRNSNDINSSNNNDSINSSSSIISYPQTYLWMFAKIFFACFLRQNT